jgi:Glycosyl transferases group 1
MSSLDRLKTIVGRVLQPAPSKPFLGAQPYGGPEDSPITLVMVCRAGFDIDVPNANSVLRLGFCRGFAQIGVRYRLVSVFELGRVLPDLRCPFVFLSCYDYEDLDALALNVLREYPHFIWLPPWFTGMERVYAKHCLPVVRMSKKVTRRILDSGAAFGFGLGPPTCAIFFEKWQKRGLRWESLPLACDTCRYFPEPKAQRFSDVKIAFVGGFRSYKNRQYDRYLKPYEDILTVYGYDQWPYRGFRGLLPEGEERVLYQNARVCPALSEPHAEVMGDIVERAFKVMGSGGLAITDVVPFYRELFGADELLVPSSVDEYHDMMQQALNDFDFNQRYRHKGYEAILARHTYSHRARKVLTYLGIRSAADVENGGQ